jgi:8-oxo-dGTP pyrophosphatase MutT (NUDIX family)
MKQAIVGVVLRGERFVAIRRGPAVVFPGYWAPPSGRLEPGETQSAAVTREMAEELGPFPGFAVWDFDQVRSMFRY